MPSWTKKSSGPSCVITRAPGYARIHGTERARRRDRDLLGPKDQHPTHDYLLLVRREPISRVFGFFLTRISMLLYCREHLFGRQLVPLLAVEVVEGKL
jgi:hypothetical protein